MSEHERSSFEKNLRSLMEALGMFEREASLLLDRFGFESDSISRLFDTLGAFSADAVRPLAAALGIADAATVEALARDVRALLQSDARARREQAASAARVEELVSAIEALGATTAALADLQARTAERLDAIAERTGSIAASDEQRTRVLEDVERLRRRIDDLESKLATEMGLGLGDEADGGEGAPVKAAGARRAPRIVQPSTSGSHKILEALPALEPKTRPA